MLIYEENKKFEKEIKFIKDVFDQITTDDCHLLIMDFDLFIVRIRQYKLFLDIRYYQQEFSCSFPLKIREKDVSMMKWLERHLMKYNISIFYY